MKENLIGSLKRIPWYMRCCSKQLVGADMRPNCEELTQQFKLDERMIGVGGLYDLYSY